MISSVARITGFQPVDTSSIPSSRSNFKETFMHVFEFRDKSNNKRVIVIGETYLAYEQTDGSVILNDEKANFKFGSCVIDWLNCMYGSKSSEWKG